MINNIQAIPKHPPRIPGEDIGKPETEFSIAASTTISSIPSQLEHVNKNLRTGGGYKLLPVTTVSTGDLTATTTSPSQPRLSSSQRALLNKDWLGSPSSKLPFTFSRTANALFKQLQQWPNYNAEKDDGK